VQFADSDALTEMLVNPLVADLELARGHSVIAIVNGLGSTYPLELSIAARAVHRQLAPRGIGIVRMLAGSYVNPLTCMAFRSHRRSLTTNSSRCGTHRCVLRL
jgi:phosphoenolpyruvate---glycerone phosphotransferase subunit DhaK